MRRCCSDGPTCGEQSLSRSLRFNSGVDTQILLSLGTSRSFGKRSDQIARHLVNEREVTKQITKSTLARTQQTAAKKKKSAKKKPAKKPKKKAAKKPKKKAKKKKASRDSYHGCEGRDASVALTVPDTSSDVHT